jgi:hypothetical protein
MAPGSGATNAKREASRRHRERQLDVAVEDSFPASDPPANTGIVGPRASSPERGMKGPAGSAASDRHAAEIAHAREGDKKPPAG